MHTFNCPFNPNKAIVSIALYFFVSTIARFDFYFACIQILFGIVNMLGTSGFTLVIKFAGKRSLYFGSLVGMSMCSFSLGLLDLRAFETASK